MNISNQFENVFNFAYISFWSIRSFLTYSGYYQPHAFRRIKINIIRLITALDLVVNISGDLEDRVAPPKKNRLTNNNTSNHLGSIQAGVDPSVKRFVSKRTTGRWLFFRHSGLNFSLPS